MKIEDLSFVTEIDREDTNNLNGGILYIDPFASVGYSPFLEYSESIVENYAYSLGLTEFANNLSYIHSINNVDIFPTVF